MVSPFTSEPERVSKEIIRQIFNDNHYYERTLSGELVTLVKRYSHRDYSSIGEPYCTRSQTVWYFNANNELIAKIHQYYRPDGTLGASGRPDPKWLNHNGRRMAIQEAPEAG